MLLPRVTLTTPAGSEAASEQLTAIFWCQMFSEKLSLWHNSFEASKQA